MTSLSDRIPSSVIIAIAIVILLIVFSFLIIRMLICKKQKQNQNDMVNCPVCSAENEADRQFCINCGTKLI